MDSIGAEVGQKMRSAIKAKLLELSCYVDDELPDYIMVMVANKRTKSQMNEDLNLFLSTKTSTFVDWLHIVLKKLKEVTVTNPEVYKKVGKRKSTEDPDDKVKKEKKSLRKENGTSKSEAELRQSLTDNLPLGMNRLSQQRQVIVVENITDENFDIPHPSQVDESTEKDLEDIERKIKSVKSRLGILVDSDLEEEIHKIKLEKADAEKELQTSSFDGSEVRTQLENEGNENCSHNNDIDMITEAEGNLTPQRRKERSPITFEEGNPKKRSVLDRLGKRPSPDCPTKSKRSKINLSEYRREEEPFLNYSSDKNRKDYNRSSDDDWKRKDLRNDKDIREERRSRDKRRNAFNRKDLSEIKNEGILCRLGVMSKIYIPPKEPEEPELADELKTREVRSVVQVKPRIIPADITQPNKNLLLKAVAEAHRSIAQTTNIGTNKKGPLKRVDETVREQILFTRKLSQTEKTKLRNIILAQVVQEDRQSNDQEKEEVYVPRPVQKAPRETPKYVPSSRQSVEDNAFDEFEIQTIKTFDGSDKRGKNLMNNLEETKKVDSISKTSVKSRLKGKKSPSPIIFDKIITKVSTKANVPDRLPIVHPPISIKNKERCKYWPGCRQGDKCEFVHPTSNCEAFPNCKFGDRCLYLHPICKFGNSCTKRDCPYTHTVASKAPVSRGLSTHAPIKAAVSPPQNCKFFPKCTNITCPFYHPKLCKFGKFCKKSSGL